MIIFKKAIDLQRHLDVCRHSGPVNQSASIGFVPTMGALHEGHASLLRACKSNNQVSVCSIFINPKQFNDPRDFEKYPSSLENDIEMLESNQCDVLFLPGIEEMYPDSTTPEVPYDLGYLDKILEGEFRPGHFQGVCMAVDRLLSIILPNKLYLGQKDYQQYMVIKRLIVLKGFDLQVAIIICPILREADGLAMSSRNVRLDQQHRPNASAMFRALSYIKQNIGNFSLPELKMEASKILVDSGLRPEYVEIADASTLHSINEWDSRNYAVALIAAVLDGVRLIDNMMLF